MAENRFQSYKDRDARSQNERRHARADEGVQLRKDKREMQLAKRRNVETLDPDDAYLYDQFDPDQLMLEIQRNYEGVMTEDPELQYRCTMEFRKILSKERDPPIAHVVQTGVVARFVQFLAREDLPTLQFEAAWALTNIASGNHQQTRVVLQNQAVPHFIHLLSSENVDVQEQATWALGNIAGDGSECRDEVLRNGAMPCLLRLLETTNKPSLLRNATWTLSNLCRGKNPTPDFTIVSKALPLLARLIYNPDEEVVTDACWAISYLCDGPNDHIQKVIDSAVCRRLVELLLSQNPGIVSPALRAIGNIVTGDDTQTQVVMNCSVLPTLLILLRHEKDSIKKEACWTVSNITAGHRNQISEVMAHNLMPTILKIMENGEFRTRKEAAWAVCNAISGGSNQHILFLVEQGCIKPLCDILSLPDAKVVEVALDALLNILRVGAEIARADPMSDGSNRMADLIQVARGTDRIVALQRHANEKVYQTAHTIISTYYNDEMQPDMVPQYPGGLMGFQPGMLPQGFHLE